MSTRRVKIIGAGSAGCHLAQAARRVGWEVFVIDNDEKALHRMIVDIFPQRYGKWDEEIQWAVEDSNRGTYDIIMIATPPDVRLQIAHKALEENPKLLHLEKPLCPPFFSDSAPKLLRLGSHSVIITVGYNHSVSESIQHVVQLVRDEVIGEVITMDVEFREHWSGIFAAHPWLSGPQDSYLGYWNRGGGAGGEHSHALHLWVYLAEIMGWKSVNEVKAMFDMKSEHKAYYDQVAAFMLRTENGKFGRVIQDVITRSTRKFLRLQGIKGFIEWQYRGGPEGDLVRLELENGSKMVSCFKNTRSDDFFQEMIHYEKLISHNINYISSPLSLRFSRKVMDILDEAHKQAGRTA